MRTKKLCLAQTGFLLALAASAPLDEFQKRVGEYVKLHKKVEGELPRLQPTDKPEIITAHQSELARRIRDARPGAKSSEIFTPEVSAEFRRLLSGAMSGPKAKRVHQSLRRAEPVRLPLQVGDPYPDNIPLQSTPPTLLLHLPKLPPELDYRVSGHNLVLRDVGANLIVDFIPDAVP